MATLGEKLLPYFDAGFSGMWVVTHEPEEAQRDLLTMISGQEGWESAVWDCARGVRFPREGTSLPDSNAPVKPLGCMSGKGEGVKVVLLHNYHRFLDNTLVLQALVNALVEGKATQTFFVVLTHTYHMPPEAEKLFLLAEHELPRREEVKKIGDEINAGEFVEGVVIDAALGMTRREVEDAFSLSVVKHGRLEAADVWDLKASRLKKKGFLELYRGTEGFDSLRGLDALKSFSRKLLRPYHDLRPRGLLLLGPPGTGKSQFAKCLGNETGRATLSLDVGRLYHKHVGETEANIREVLHVADAMGKVILFADEIEKSLSGVGSEGDSGVSTRLFGTLLTWLSDRDERNSDVFFIATCNDVNKLPPEFSRAERFDGIFFLDLPSIEEKAAIWEFYTKAYGITDRPTFNDEGWTGAEIKSCCRLSKLLDVPLGDAAKNVVPVSMTNKDKVTALREWAKHRCLSANTEGVYKGVAEVKETKRRKLNKPNNPELN